MKSRYYYPEICRFISADAVTVMIASPMSLGDKNLYAYCDNDPVNKKDEDGDFPQFVAMGIIGAAANVGVSFITAKALGQDYGWKNLLEDAITGALSAVPILSLTIKTKRDMKIVGIALTIVKAGWFYKTGKEKGYSSKKAALYSGTSLLLETPDFSGMETPKVTRELLKQLGLNVTYEVGFSFMRTGVNAAFDVSDTSRTARKTGAYSSSKYMPSINKETGFIRPIENPIEYVVNRSHL